MIDAKRFLEFRNKTLIRQRSRYQLHDTSKKRCRTACCPLAGLARARLRRRGDHGGGPVMRSGALNVLRQRRTAEALTTAGRRHPLRAAATPCAPPQRTVRRRHSSAPPPPSILRHRVHHAGAPRARARVLTPPLVLARLAESVTNSAEYALYRLRGAERRGRGAERRVQA